jgi:hypothetical protein
LPNFRTIIFVITLFCLLLIVGIAISCSTKKIEIETNIEIERFDFLQDGNINRKEIIDRLGLIFDTYENGRIVIYNWFDHDKSKLYNIVLVFNEDNVLEKHSIVRVR